MTDRTPTGDLRDRIDVALRTVGLARNLAAYRDAVLPVVEAETADAERRRDQAENRAALFREQVRMEHERAEEAERQRDDALAAVQRVGRELGGLCEFLAGWTDEHNANVTEHEIKSMRFAAKEMRRILAALDQPADSPAKETP